MLGLNATVHDFLKINTIITYHYKLHLSPSNEPDQADEPRLKRYWDELVLPSERLDSSSNMKTALPRSHGTNYGASTRCLQKEHQLPSLTLRKNHTGISRSLHCQRKTYKMKKM